MIGLVGMTKHKIKIIYGGIKSCLLASTNLLILVLHMQKIQITIRTIGGPHLRRSFGVKGAWSLPTSWHNFTLFCSKFLPTMQH